MSKPFKHHTAHQDHTVMVERLRDQAVFGTYRVVRSIKHQQWRLVDGHVQVRDHGIWSNVVEADEDRTNRILALTIEQSTLDHVWGVTGCVRVQYHDFS